MLDRSISLHFLQWALASHPVQEAGTPCVNCLGRESYANKKILSSAWFVEGPPCLPISVLHSEIGCLGDDAGLGADPHFLETSRYRL